MEYQNQSVSLVSPPSDDEIVRRNRMLGAVSGYRGSGMGGSNMDSRNMSPIGQRSFVGNQSFGGISPQMMPNNAGRVQATLDRGRGFRPTGGADEMSGVAVGRRPDMNPVERARMAGMGGSMPVSSRGAQLAAAVRGNGY